MNSRNEEHSSKPGMYRIIVLISGALNCFAVGSCYLYGVFQPYIMEYFDISSAAASTPFTLVWMFMTIAQFIAGPLQKHVGVKATAVIGLALMALGCLGCSALSPDMAGMLSLCYTVVLGLGLGIGYNAVAATTVRWFPDHKGVATSISIGMMGGAGILLPPLFGTILAEQGLQMAFRCQALVFVPCILLTLAVFKDTPAGYMADYVPKGIVAKQTSARECMSIRDLVTTRDAWLLVLLYFSLVPVYVIASSVFVSFGADAKQLDPAVAVWFVSAASIVQVIGRFSVPSISDRLGRRAVFFLVLGIMAVGVTLVAIGGGVVYALAFCALSFAYGGGVTAMPAIVSDRLGTKNATQNIAFSEIGTLLGSLASFVLVNTLSTGPAIVISGLGGAILGVSVLFAIFGFNTARRA
uniref:Putative membrane transport protein n=1 Tax=uncultured bacterium Contig19 TaxID=1393523 RepID=W0FMF7_9BACT|nr:putative membrane transport protein [uncultured bacterium Contig19]